MKRKKPSGFDERLNHSIELLKKAESLAIRYDSENGYYLAFSSGKDSQALYHVAQMAGVKFQANMNFTSVDPPQVIRFVREHYPDVITHAPEKSIYQLAVEHQLLPSRNIRWCCADFKEYAGAGKVCLIGIRASESARRAKRHEVEVSSKKFSGDLEQFFEWQKTELERREGILLRRMKREGKKVNEDYFSLQKDNEIRCINGKDSILISMWVELVGGDTDFPFRIERDMYVLQRVFFNSHGFDGLIDHQHGLCGWYGFAGSFNGRFFDGGYSGHNVNGRDYISEQIRNILGQTLFLKGVEWQSKDYFDIEIPDNSTIYCDIPYKGTKQYSTSKDFDYERFYDWCRDMRAKGHRIFISEYQMPDDFVCVWEKQITNAMNQKNTYKPIERLFTI